MSKLSEKLGKHLETYTSNPSKRCYIEKVGLGAVCKYSGQTLGIKTKGCFIGALLPSKDRIKIDKFFGDNKPSTVNNLIDIHEIIDVKLPPFIKNNRRLMSALQHLHDESRHWTSDGLSWKGKDVLLKIINDYGLNEKDFEKSLK